MNILDLSHIKKSFGQNDEINVITYCDVLRNNG